MAYTQMARNNVTSLASRILLAIETYTDLCIYLGSPRLGKKLRARASPNLSSPRFVPHAPTLSRTHNGTPGARPIASQVVLLAHVLEAENISLCRQPESPTKCQRFFVTFHPHTIVECARHLYCNRSSRSHATDMEPRETKRQELDGAARGWSKRSGVAGARRIPPCQRKRTRKL
jgi:hypothetical protein